MAGGRYVSPALRRGGVLRAPSIAAHRHSSHERFGAPHSGLRVVHAQLKLPYRLVGRRVRDHPRVTVRGRFATPIATTASSRDVQLREFPRLLHAAASIDSGDDACTAQTLMTLPIHEIIEPVPRI
ncbi:hypothetical protein BVI2075_1260013 [Burkholderia vietnamiensis]|nr:hypothetical protein BVI2075_1260013 [Burkholderia vietnamiensis]